METDRPTRYGQPTPSDVREALGARMAGLSARECEVFILIGLGRTNRQIGERLFISQPTVATHVSNILAKLGCANRTEAAVIAAQAAQVAGSAQVSANSTKTKDSPQAPRRTEVRFARADDGASIAWATAGSGPPVVLVPNFPFCHASLITQLLPEWFDALASRVRLSWYDVRGCGLSQREPLDFSLDRLVRDLGLVVRAAGGAPPILCCMGNGTPIGIRFAALHPEALSGFVVIDGWATVDDLKEMTSQQVAVALLGVEWKTYSEAIAGLTMGYGAGDAVIEYASFIRSCVSSEAHRAAARSIAHIDVTPDMRNVRAPTLILHSPSHRWRPLSAGERIAKGIEGARFQLNETAYSFEGAARVLDFVFERSGANKRD